MRGVTTHTAVLRSLACVALMSLFVSFIPKTSWAWDRGLQCVPFARALSSIRLFGDAWRWWSTAAGLYNRGTIPQAGSILSFRPDARMPLGHIAVVTRVLNGREIEVDHANWAVPGAISRQVQILDVSTDNNWAAVRVGLRDRDRFGAVYATNGFIYGRPVELGPQIINVAEALRAFRGDGGSGIGTLPVVVGPTQTSADVLPNNRLPIVIYGHRDLRVKPGQSLRRG